MCDTTRRRFLGLLVLAAVGGCEGDKERLNRVGKKLAQKARRTSDEAGIPRVKLERPPGQDPKN